MPADRLRDIVCRRYGPDQSLSSIVMKSLSRLRFLPLFGVLGIALASLLLFGQATSSAPQRISFPFKNASDLRGIYNVFSAFRQACLDQPVTRDLPASLVPDDYKIVSSLFHMYGEGESAVKNVAILSRTGSEDEDFAGGHPIVSLTMPGEGNPNGRCSIGWKRTWDYAQDQVPKIMHDTAVRLDAHVSFRLAAYLISKPLPSFRHSERYSLFTEWAAPCWGEHVCRFSLLTLLDPDDGIEMRLSRKGILADETQGRR